MTSDANWRHLEQRVAQYFERNGYTARTNQREQGRSGLVHEIDVLAERRDAAGTHRVAVECKFWRSPVEKDVIYKLERVMQDLGLSKGIVVSSGGLRAGARVAAEQAHIEVWGRNEIRHYLGAEALAGQPLATPDEALGVELSVPREVAEREIRKARGGFAGIGGEEVASVDLVWVPAFELHLAVTRLRPGLLGDREEVIRRWNLFEALTGRLIGQRDNPRSFVMVGMQGAVVRMQKTAPQIIGEMRRTLGKHRNARTDVAEKRRQFAYNAIGLPGSTREFAVEGDKQVFIPYYVGLLRRKGSERFVAIHAGLGVRSEALEQALHEKIDVVRGAISDAERSDGTPMEPAEPAAVALEAPKEVAQAPVPPSCRCGATMALRRRKTDGEAFWGCSTFPRCRHTAPME